MYFENDGVFPKYELELKPQWWAMFILPITTLIFGLLYFLGNPSAEDLNFWQLFVIILIFIILPTIFGFLRKRVRRIFKIDDPHQVLIIETYWHEVKVHKKRIPLNKIQKFRVKSKVGKKKGRTTSINYLALAYKSGKTKILSLGADEPYVDNYAHQLNDFLLQYTTISKETIQKKDPPNMTPRQVKFYVILAIFLLLALVVCIIMLIYYLFFFS